MISVVLAVACGLLAGGFRHEVGMAPVLAGLLCASCFLRRRDVAIVGLGATVVRDVLSGVSVFTLVRLLGMLAVIGIIWALRARPSFKSLLLGLGLSSPAYHLVLATGDWVTHTCSKLPLTPQGFYTSIATSIPYFQRSLVNDLLLTSAFLSFYTLAGYLVVLRWPSVLPQPSRG